MKKGLKKPLMEKTMKKILMSTMLFAAFMGTAGSVMGADGEALYKSKCLMCHGADGSGSTPAGKAMGARDLRAPEVQKQTDAEIAKIVAEGRKKMPAFKNQLSEKELAAVVSFVRSLAQPAK